MSVEVWKALGTEHYQIGIGEDEDYGENDGICSQILAIILGYADPVELH